MASKRKQLHQSPPEFAKAAEQRRCWQWREQQERAERRAKRDRERVMPAHLPANPARVIYYDKSGAYYESHEKTLDRIWRRAHRKAHKVVHPLYHRVFGHSSSHS